MRGFLQESQNYEDVVYKNGDRGIPGDNKNAG